MADDIRIAIGEDHPFFRDGLRRALEAARGFQVVAEATDGVSALEHVRSLKPDVAILDIGLPRMNGFAVVRALRAEQLPVEVIFLTIHDDDAMFEEALELGVKGICSRTARTPSSSGASGRWCRASTMRAHR